MSDYNRKDELNRALAYAVRGNILADVTECIRSGADLDARHRFLYNRTVLMEASSRGYSLVAKTLIENGASVNLTDEDGWSALMLTACKGHDDIARLLIEANADVNQQTKSGQTALHKATRWGRNGIVDLLLKNHAATGLTDKDGETALHIAARKGNDGSVHLLLKNQADSSIKNNEGRTAMELAESYPSEFAEKGGLTRVVDLLKTYELQKTTAKEDQAFQVKGQPKVQHRSQQLCVSPSERPAEHQVKRQYHGEMLGTTSIQHSVSKASSLPERQHLSKEKVSRGREQTRPVSATARPFHDEELVQQLTQQMEQLILERDSKERENGQLKQQNQVLHHQLNNSIREKDGTTQLAESLQQSLNDKDVALQEASQAVSLLQRDLDEKERQKESALQEANQTIERLQNELERQTRETVGVTEHNALRRNVREFESLLSDAEATIGISRKRLEESKEVLKVASQDIHLTDTKLGQGSYGEVRIAYWRGCPVAVKMLYEVLATVQRNIELLLQEVSVAWKIHHPNVAGVCGVTLETEGTKRSAWIVMELLQGSLGGVIDASRVEGVGALTLREQLDMAHDSLCGLDYLHSLPRTVLHGDIRPTNILVTAVMRAKLGDLGAARFSDASLSLGPLSPEYIASERLDGRAAHKSMETDIYSMGVTICELFTATAPLRAEREDQMHLIQQRSVRYVCMQMVSNDPCARPSAGGALEVIDRVSATKEYKDCPPRRMVKGKMDGASDVTLVRHMW